MEHPIPIVLERELPEYTSVTIVKEHDDKWYACFVVKYRVPAVIIYQDTKHLGIDMGLTNFITTSAGDKIKAPKFFKESEKKLAKLNKRLSAKTKGSRRWLKVKRRFNKEQAKIRRKRSDWLHKLSHKIANDNNIEAVAVETLNIQRIIKRRRLAKSLYDVSWKTFLNQIEYKLTALGKLLTFSNAKFPSTQLCSTCHQKTGPKSDLNIRMWTCISCETIHDRDINAARNIARDADRRIAA